MTIENHHEQIISRELWNLAQERLRKNNKHGDGDGGHSNRYVFSGRIKCGECGSSFVGRFRYMKDGTRIRRWCCGTATRCGVQSCNVGKLIRDDDAMQMLQKAVRSIPLDIQAVIRDVTDLAMEAIGAEENCSRAECNRNRYEIKQIQKKKEAVLDSYFSGEITKEDMVTMKRKYDDRLEQLILGREEAIRAQTDFAAVRTEIQAELAAILDGSVISEVFSKTVLESFTVFRDRHMELKLRHLPQVFRFSD